MKNEDINYKFGIYCRKSSDTEDKQVQSIETQERELEDFKDRNSLLVKRRWREEKSAFKIGREFFADLIDSINKSEVNALLVIHPNRIARNPIDGATIIDAMDRGKLLCVRTPTRTYLNTSIDKMMLGLEFLFSKRDSDDKSVLVKNGQKTKALKGYPHGLSALGFTNDKTEERGNRKWLVDEIRLPFVKELLSMFLTGTWSGNKLTKYAREVQRFTTPKHKKLGGKLIVRSMIYTMLANPIYSGFFFQNGVRYELNQCLPRLITESQHSRIIQLLRRKHSPKVKSHSLAFSGFVRSPKGECIGQDVKFQVICDCKLKFAYMHKEACPKCGKLIDDIENPKYLEYRKFYNVPRKKAGLKTHSVDESKLQDFVLNYFKENIQISPALAKWSKNHLHELKDKEIERDRAMALNEKGKAEEAEKRKRKILQLMADEQITAEDGKDMIAELNQIISSKNNLEIKSSWFDKANEIIDLNLEFVAILKSDDVQAKRRVLGKLGSNLIWDEEKISICNTKWMDALISGLKEAKTKNPRFEPENIVDTSSSNSDFSPISISLLRG